MDIAEVSNEDGSQEIGAINAPETVQLIECMRSGRQYVAVVLSTGDALVVHVQNA